MAFPLSVSTLSNIKLSINVYLTPSTEKLTSITTTQFRIPLIGVHRKRIFSPKFNRILQKYKNDDSTHLTSLIEKPKGRKQLESAVAAFVLCLQLTLSPIIPSAEAVLYSPETKIPRTGELALRRAIPANTNMKAIQDSLEDISYLLRIPQRKPYGTMEGNVKKALKIALDEKESILSSIPSELKEEGSVLYASLTDGKDGLKNLIESIKNKDADKVSVGLASSLDIIAQLELLQAPGLSFLLPAQYLNYPRLTGRAIVEFAIGKGDSSTFSPESGGQPRNNAIIQVVLDGYSAPLTAGNFAKLVR